MTTLRSFQQEITDVHEKALKAQREQGHAAYLAAAAQAHKTKDKAQAPPTAALADLSLAEKEGEPVAGGQAERITLEELQDHLIRPEPDDAALRSFLEQEVRLHGGEVFVSLGALPRVLAAPDEAEAPASSDGDASKAVLTPDQVARALDALRALADTVACKVNVLYEGTAGEGRHAYTRVLVRRIPESPEFVQEVRVAVCGNVDAGKSTLLGVLTKGGLDDGRGKMRVNLFRHKHEIESGRTSSVGLEIMGFDPAGHEVVASPATTEGSRREKLSWDEICRRSGKIVSFIDLAGHERYLKTTIFGLTGSRPDFVILMVASNAGLIGMSKEHLAVALALNVPVIVCVTKIDMCPPHVLEQTLKQLSKILKSPGCRKSPVFVRSKEIAVELSQSFVKDRLAPIFLISNVTGAGVDDLKLFLNCLPQSYGGREIVEQPLEYQINEVYSVPFAGTVVNGIILTGSVRPGDQILLGPDSLGHWTSTTVKSIQRKRANVAAAEAGQSVSMALKRVRRTAVRKGQVILAKSEVPPKAVRRFTGSILVLYHQTTIKPSYQAMAHIGAVRQTVRVVGLDNEKGLLRTGDRANVLFEFVSTPEYIKEGMKLLFREGRTKGLGVVTSVEIAD